MQPVSFNRSLPEPLSDIDEQIRCYKAGHRGIVFADTEDLSLARLSAAHDCHLLASKKGGYWVCKEGDLDYTESVIRREVEEDHEDVRAEVLGYITSKRKIDLATCQARVTISPDGLIIRTELIDASCPPPMDNQRDEDVCAHMQDRYMRLLYGVE